MNKVWVKLCLLVFWVIVLGGGVIASAQSGGSYDLSWHSVAGGGGASSSSNYAVTGTIGQAVVGYSSNSTYELGSGFWNANSSVGMTGNTEYSIFLPLVKK